MDKLKEACLQSGNFTTVLIPYYSQVIVEENSDKVRMLRIEALRDLSSQLLRYEKSGYDKKLLASLAVKKAELIMQASTKSEMERIRNPKPPHFDGVKFIADAYLVPEEELICWSETSLQAPLNEYGMKRYTELFRQVYPEKIHVSGI